MDLPQEWNASTQDVEEMLRLGELPMPQLDGADEVVSPSGLNSQDHSNPLNTYFQQRAIHLFVMQQLFLQYSQTMQDFRKYLVQETQNFNRDMTANKNTPAAEYSTQLPTKLKQQISQFQAFQSFYDKLQENPASLSKDLPTQPSPPTVAQVANNPTNFESALHMASSSLPLFSQQPTSTSNSFMSQLPNTSPVKREGNMPFTALLDQIFQLPQQTQSQTQPQQSPQQQQSSPQQFQQTYQQPPQQQIQSQSHPQQQQPPVLDHAVLQQRIRQLQQQQVQLQELQLQLEQKKLQNQLLTTSGQFGTTTAITLNNTPASITLTNTPASSVAQITQHVQNQNPPELATSLSGIVPPQSTPISSVPTQTTATSQSNPASTTATTAPTTPSTPTTPLSNPIGITPQLTPITPILSTSAESPSKYPRLSSQSPTPDNQPSPIHSPSQYASSPVLPSQSQPKSTQPTQPTQPTQSAQSTQSTQPTQPTQSTQSVQSTQPTQSTQSPQQQEPHSPPQPAQQSSAKQKPMKFHMVNYRKRPLSDLLANADGPTLQRSQSLLPSLPTPSLSSNSSTLSADQQIHNQIQTLNQQFIHDQQHQQLFQQQQHIQLSSLPQISQSQVTSSSATKLRIYPELLTMKQSDAAKILGISASMLSKRWRETMNGKKWPYRVHRKLQKEMDATNNEDEEISPAILATMNEEYIEI